MVVGTLTLLIICAKREVSLSYRCPYKYLKLHVCYFQLQVRSTRMNQDSTLAKRMMLIILTDFACWFPVIIISILALTGSLYDPTKQVYAWIAVFVLPINSSINPLLYTFSTPYVRKNIPSAKRALKRRRRQNRRRGGSKIMKFLFNFTYLL